MTGDEPDPGMHGIGAVVEFLTRAQASYELTEHRDTFAAVDEARVSGGALERMAKTVVLHDRGGFRAVVIPASERVDLQKARAQFGASRHLRLASEEEIQREFPAFDAGALPPFGALLGTPEILDARLLDYHHVLCSGGDHRHTLNVSPREIERLGHPIVADVCQLHRTVPEKEKILTHQPEGDPMPATTKPAPRARATAAARDRAENDARRLEHVTQSLAAVQKDLSSVGGSLGSGMRDLRRDVSWLVRDARRDLLKMRRAVRRDFDRLQKDLTTAGTAKPPAARRPARATTRTAKRQTAGSSH